MNLMEVLRGSPLFESFGESELEVLERAMSVEEYPDGHIFMKEGDPGDTLMLVVDGTIRITRQLKEGRGITLGTMKRGEIFGLLALLDYGTRSATCTGVGPTTVASLPRSAFTLLYKGDANFMYRFQYIVARQLVKDARTLNDVLANALVAEDRDEEGRSHSPSRILSSDFHLSTED